MKLKRNTLFVLNKIKFIFSSKSFSKFLTARSEGAMLMLLAVAIVTTSALSALEFFKTSASDLQAVRNKGNKLHAFYCAKTGFEAAVTGLKKIGEELLYKTQIAFNPPPIPLAGCNIYFRLIPEDGKLNLNYLVNAEDNPSDRYRAIFSDLFELLNIDYTEIDKIVDYIDRNSEPMPSGMEEEDYLNLKNPRKIKNNYMYSLKELFVIPGFGRDLLYESRKPEDYDETHSTDFATEVEKMMPSNESWILTNNITAFSYDTILTDAAEKININAAPYFVLKSLSTNMTKAAIKRILEARLNADNGFYISQKIINGFKNYPEFQIELGGITLYDELFSSGDLGSGRLKTGGRFYRIIGYAEYKGTNAYVEALIDNKNTKSSTVKILYYKES